MNPGVNSDTSNQELSDSNRLTIQQRCDNGKSPNLKFPSATYEYCRMEGE